MAMPNNYVLVRHGESEGNVATRAGKDGNLDFFTDEFRERPGHDWRLTPKGVSQANAAGEWIKRFILNGGTEQFDKFYVSPHRRTRETAGHLALQGALWLKVPRLRERDWGDIESLSRSEFEERYPESAHKKRIDSLYWRPPGGESIAQVGETRVQRFYDTLHREAPGKDVIAVTHGETIWANRFEQERMDHEKWAISERDAAMKIKNCQVVQYTRLDPESGEQASKVLWVRSVCPWETPDNPGEWEQIERRGYTNEELLAEVEQLPRLEFPEA
jgi:broad specificity phosphatase PhoE